MVAVVARLTSSEESEADISPPVTIILALISKATFPGILSWSPVTPDKINSFFPLVVRATFDGLPIVAEKLMDPGLSAVIRATITWSGNEQKTFDS